MKNSLKFSVVSGVLLLLVISGYFLTQKTSDSKVPPSETITIIDSNWLKENPQDVSGDTVFSRQVKLSENTFENQRIAISVYNSTLDPEEWVAAQIDLNDVLVITHEWGFFDNYRHLRIESRTISDDAQIDYFFKDNEVISFVFQPLHALQEPKTKDYYLKTIEEYLDR